MEMLKHFNIKIDNPLVFMEQTTMKQFIQGDDKIKYEVLMQAMNFKSLEQKYLLLFYCKLALIKLIQILLP